MTEEERAKQRAFELGKRAYREGESNPFFPGTLEHAAWIEGYDLEHKSIWE